MDPIVQPADAAAAAPAPKPKKRKPLNMSPEAVTLRDKIRRGKENRAEYKEIVETIQALYMDRIEEVIRKDNKKAFNVILRNRNFGIRAPDLADTDIVKLLFTHDAVQCMKKLGPYDKYNKVDHFADIDINLIMDPNHRDIVAEFLWRRQSNVLMLSYHSTEEHDEVSIGGRNVHGSDVRFRSKSILRLLRRGGPTIKERVSFLRDMLARSPFASINTIAGSIGVPSMRRGPSKQELLIQRLWMDIREYDWESRKAEGELFAHTVIEALSDDASDYWSGMKSLFIERPLFLNGGYLPDDAPRDFPSRDFCHVVRRVQLQRATGLYSILNTELTPRGFEEKHLLTMILAYTNPETDAQIHDPASPALLEVPLSRKLFFAARKEAKRVKASLREQKRQDEKLVLQQKEADALLLQNEKLAADAMFDASFQANEADAAAAAAHAQLAPMELA